VPETSGDILVLPAAASDTAESSARSAPATPERLIRVANLKFYRFAQDPVFRRQILGQLFEVMRETQPFTWEDIQRRMLDETTESDVPLSATVLSRYRTMLFQSRAFQFKDDQHGVAQRKRRTWLNPELQNQKDLVRLYEANVAYKIAQALADQGQLTPEVLAGVLGLGVSSEEELEYCRTLILQSAAVAPEESETG